MSDRDSTDPPREVVKRILHTEFKTDTNGQDWKRRVGEEEWVLVPTAAEERSPNAIRLFIIRQDQAEGEPKHWSLFVGRENEKGTSYQVTGDATHMVQKFEENVDKWNAPDFYSHYDLNAEVGIGEAKAIWEAVNEEKPPQAPDRRSVTENCQGWTIRVLKNLVKRGVVKQGAVDSIEKDWLEPV
ncbi:hypothetical protein QBC46DRAFT_400828 [Diplogelasinospora grovesii]|uniref:Uncharacterized protein n=1 Tax=Diplogelasinospora grovesii TaxID=303347 RepID=A0AAN6RYN8_9PEZI|nr:hypothetical protein QBC46DRAFT_400828 [Diplogelasinospora grovesii]